MSAFFVIFLLLLALLLQKRLEAHSLDALREDAAFDASIVEPGRPFHLVVTLENTRRRYIPFLRVEGNLSPTFHLAAENGTEEERAGSSSGSLAFSTWLRPRQQARFQIPVFVAQRGRYVLPSLTVCGGDFLGLKKSERAMNPFREVVAPPREAPEPELGIALGSFLGELSVSRFLYEDPVLTVGFREYTGREPMKMISWKQSARAQGLMVKKYDYTVEPSAVVLLNVDTQSARKPELLEQCFSLARTVCRMLEERGVKYAFATNAAMAGAMRDPSLVEEGLGQRHFAVVLESLGRALHIPKYSCDQLLSNYAGAYSPACGRILITPAGEADKSPVLPLLKGASGGNVLIIRGEAFYHDDPELSSDAV